MPGLPDDNPIIQQLDNLIEGTLERMEPCLREYFDQIIERQIPVDDQFIMGFVHGQRHMFMNSTNPGASSMRDLWVLFPEVMQRADERMAARIRDLVEIIRRER